MPLTRGRSVRLGELLHRDSFEAAPSGAASAYPERLPVVSCRTSPAPGHGVDLSVVTCPSCRTSNDPDRKFCVECGHALTSGCRVCGAANPAGAKFCGTCGNRLNSGVATDNGATDSPPPA